MPQITLSSEQVQDLATFIRKHGLKTFFLAKDQGAYVGASGGSREEGTFENIIFYFRGMDPSKENYEGEAWDNARDAFGGDDFGECLEAEFILKMADKHEPKVRIVVTETQIKMDGTFKKPAPTSTPKSKKSKGEQIRDLLSKGVSVTAIVALVGTTENSVRWHKSKMNKAA